MASNQSDELKDTPPITTIGEICDFCTDIAEHNLMSYEYLLKRIMLQARKLHQLEDDLECLINNLGFSQHSAMDRVRSLLNDEPSHS